MNFRGGCLGKGKHILSMPSGKHIFGTVTVGEKGQLVIPKKARDIFDIKPGDMLLVLGDEEQGLIITKTDRLNEIALDIMEKK